MSKGPKVDTHVSTTVGVIKGDIVPNGDGAIMGPLAADQSHQR